MHMGNKIVLRLKQNFLKEFRIVDKEQHWKVFKTATLIRLLQDESGLNLQPCSVTDPEVIITRLSQIFSLQSKVSFK